MPLHVTAGAPTLFVRKSAYDRSGIARAALDERLGLTADAQGVHLLDVGVHDAAAGGPSKEEYIRRSAKFGVRSEHKHVLVPGGEVTRITPLGQLPVE